MKIGINCGHTVSGTIGSGAVGYLNESDETRKVGYALIDMLRAAGHTVFDCTNDRAESVNDNLRQICSLANAQTLDLFVSIHFNAGGGQGCEVYTYEGEKHAEAVSVCRELSELGFRNRGVKRQDLYVINHTRAKAMLIEVCFADTPTDVMLYNKLGADRVARAICNAICDDVASDTDNASTEPQKSELDKLADRVTRLEKPMIYNYIDDNMPGWAREAVRWAVDNGILKGDENGLNLDDKDLRYITFMYRMFGVVKAKF